MAYPLQPISITTATLTLNEESHGNGALLKLNRAGGIALTLPVATGNGHWYDIVVETTQTSSATIKVPNASGTIQGTLVVSGATSGSFSTAADSDTITLNGTTSGGIKGSRIKIQDMGTNVWMVTGTLTGSGVAITPFSATV